MGIVLALLSLLFASLGPITARAAQSDGDSQQDGALDTVLDPGPSVDASGELGFEGTATAALGHVGRRQVFFASVADAEASVPALADRMDIVGYDLEHWPATPADEQADPVAAAQRLQALARQHGLAAGIGPDRLFAVEYGAAMAPYVDRFTLQLQRTQSDPVALLDFAGPLIQELRQANPDLEIFAQLRAEGTVEELLSIVESLRDDIDGVSILYSPDSVDWVQEFVARLRSGELNGVWFGIRLSPELVDWFNHTACPGDVAAVSVHQVALLDQIAASPDAPTVAGVQFSVDGGEWQHAVADDGQFDAVVEGFKVALTDLASGEHTLVVRAIDSEGRVEANTETQSFQVDPVFTVFMPMIQR